MNERIKLLAEQAGVGFMFDPDAVVLTFKMEKFAESIIEECVAQCWSVSELEHKGSVVSECSKRMRKYFGVEV